MEAGRPVDGFNVLTSEVADFSQPHAGEHADADNASPGSVRDSRS